MSTTVEATRHVQVERARHGPHPHPLGVRGMRAADAALELAELGLRALPKTT